MAVALSRAQMNASALTSIPPNQQSILGLIRNVFSSRLAIVLLASGVAVSAGASFAVCRSAERESRTRFSAGALAAAELVEDRIDLLATAPQRAIELDREVDARVRAAAERARDDGAATLLPADPAAGRTWVALFSPSYRQGEPIRTIAERRRAFVSVSEATIPTEDLLRGVPHGEADAIDVELYAASPSEVAALGTSAGERLLVSSSSARRMGDAAWSPFSSRAVAISLAGQPGTFFVTTLPSFAGAGIAPIAVLVAGLVITALLAILAGALRSERARARAIADAMTADLREREVAITKLQQVTAETKEAAEAANHAKTDFLANVSHEIRTPMNAILGYAELLLEPSLAPSERFTYIRTIQRSAELLLTIVNDILDVSKIEAGKMTLESIASSPTQVVADVASLMRVHALDKKLAFEIKFKGPIPKTIATDPTRVRQILMNLVGNAIKFTEAGSVRVTVRCDRSDPKKPALAFTIADTGIGMTREQFGRLFRPFTQADTSMTRRFGGTGLGLVICRRLATLLGGTLTAESELGQGSTFVFTIPTGSLEGVEMLVDVEEAVEREPRSVATHGADAKLRGKILLAEDGPENQVLVSTHLRKAGLDVTIVENGRLAVDAAKAAVEAGRPFDIILMDMQMPVLDGYRATATLREEGYGGTIIALTAHAMVGDRARCLASGCDDYLSKPVSRAGIIAMVRRYLEDAVAARITAPTPEPAKTSAAPLAIVPVRSIAPQPPPGGRAGRK